MFEEFHVHRYLVAARKCRLLHNDEFRCLVSRLGKCWCLDFVAVGSSAKVWKLSRDRTRLTGSKSEKKKNSGAVM